MNQKSALYSKQINDLYNESTNIKNSEAKSKANDLIIDLRSSQQYSNERLIFYLNSYIA